jgi:hypothetical protein
MIDTIRFRTNRKLKVSPFTHLGLRRLPENRDIRVRVVQAGQQQYITAVETSIPKVAFGNNVRVLETEEEFEWAFGKLINQLDAISSKDGFELTRVDLGWNYRGKPLEFFLAHEHLNHPMVRKAVASYIEPWENSRIIVTRDNATRTGLEWQGSKIRIRFYDKTKDAKKLGHTEQLIRVEVQLRGKLLRKLLGGNEKQPVHKLLWGKCYPVFRDILRKFPGPEVVPILDGQDKVNLAALRAGIAVFDILGKGKNRTTVHRLRKRLGRLQLRKYGVDWTWMLPDEFPPPKTVTQPPARASKTFKLRPKRPFPKSGGKT